MSGTQENEPGDLPDGLLGDLLINDHLIEIIRHPDNKHLDEQKEPEPPKAP